MNKRHMYIQFQRVHAAADCLEYVTDGGMNRRILMSEYTGNKIFAVAKLANRQRKSSPKIWRQANTNTTNN